MEANYEASKASSGHWDSSCGKWLRRVSQGGGYIPPRGIRRRGSRDLLRRKEILNRGSKGRPLKHRV